MPASTFPETRWTLIQRCKTGSETEQAQALNDLCRAYWLPLYTFARRFGSDPHASEDLVQGFFLALLKSELFRQADDQKGRLRTLLCTVFSRYVATTRAHDNCKKRGGHLEHLPLLPDNAEGIYQEQFPSSDLPPDAAYNRAWAQNVLNRSLQRLGNQFDEKGQKQRFQVMRDYLPWNGGSESCEGGAAAAGMNPNAFRTALLRMRKKYRDCIFSEVRETLVNADDATVEAEVRDLFQVLSS